jgi:peptide/nickel transport system permease protein
VVVGSRLAFLPLVFLASTFLVFLLARLHDPAAGGEGSLPSAYAGFLGRLCSLDFGVSSTLQPGEPVADIALAGLKTSLGLVVGAVVFSMLLAAGFAWRSAKRADPVGPGAGGAILLLASAAPVFVIAYVARDLVNPLVASLAQREVLESPRPYLLGMGAGPLQYTIAAITLGLGDAFLAHLGLSLKDETVAVRAKDFVHASEMNGGPTSVHVLRNLLVPGLSTIAARLPVLLGGVVVVETAYSLNGAGRILWRAAIEGDLDVLMAVTVLLTAVVVGVRLVVEVVALARDPRGAR